jgi:hypothetical protein
MTGDHDDNQPGRTTRPSTGLDPVETALGVVGDALASVVDYGAWRLDDGQVQDRFADALRVRAGVEELVARLAASVVDRELPRLGGASSTKAWLVSTHGLSGADAARLVAETTAHHGDVDGVLRDGRTEATRVAWAAGDLSAERAVLIARTVDRFSPDIPADRTDALQTDLVQHSKVLSYTQLQHACRHAVQVVDPDGADAFLEAQLLAEEAKALQQTELWMRHAGPGLVRIGGLIPTLHANMLKTVLDAHSCPRHQATTTTGGGSDDNPYSPTLADDGADQLTHPQRNGRAFLDVIEHIPTTELPQHGVASTRECESRTTSG